MKRTRWFALFIVFGVLEVTTVIVRAVALDFFRSEESAAVERYHAQCVYLVERSAANPCSWQTTAVSAVAAMEQWERVSKEWETIATNNQRNSDRFERMAVDCRAAWLRGRSR